MQKRSRRRKAWTDVRVPVVVGDYIRMMSRRLRVPPYRVVEAALNDYIERLPSTSRERFRRTLERHGAGNRTH